LGGIALVAATAEVWILLALKWAVVYSPAPFGGKHPEKGLVATSSVSGSNVK